MTTLSDIQWGSGDAKLDQHQDTYFTKRFVDTGNISELFQDRYKIITGEKGSGKTAIRMAYCTEGSPYFRCFDYTAVIDFNSLSFGPFLQETRTLSSQTGIEQLKLLTNHWFCLIITEAVREYVRNNPAFQEEIPIPTIKSVSERANWKKGVIYTLQRLLEASIDIWSKRPPNQSRADSLEIFSTLPRDDAFMEFAVNFCKILKNTHKRILIVLDGFDQLSADYHVHHRLQKVFDSLIESVFDLSSHRELDIYLTVKAMIPHDRFISTGLRDLDKIRFVHKAIRWDKELLQQMVFKIINASVSKPFPNFEVAWKALMPEQIENQGYKVEEETFDYILRHTMYRPRQLQTHLRNIADKFPGLEIDGNMIRLGMAQSCRNMVTDYTNEYRVDHPHLKEFLNLFRNSSNVMKYSDFFEIVRKAIQKFDNPEVRRWPSVEEKLISLYKIGFFGVVEFAKDNVYHSYDEFYSPPRVRSSSPEYRCHFYYSSPYYQFTPNLHKEALVATHPIFFDYCEQSRHPEMIVG